MRNTHLHHYRMRKRMKKAKIKYVVAVPGMGLKPIAICPCKDSALAAARLMLGDRWYIAEVSETHILGHMTDYSKKWRKDDYELSSNELEDIATYENSQ